MNPRALRAVALLGAAGIVWLAGQRGAWGHALLLDSLPRADAAAPASLSRVVLRFNSSVEKSLSRLVVAGPDGRRFALRVALDGAPDQLIAPIPTLAPGRYVLEWQVLSADGHLTRGSFPFRFGRAP